MNALIELKHLEKTFKTKSGEVTAINDISLSIEQGDIFGIIGMSGAGKSTLVRCLNLLERPTSGQVLIEGNDLCSMNDKALRKVRSDIAMIFQHFNLLMQKTVLENVAFPLRIRHVSKKSATERAMELLKIVGLEDKARAYPAELSGGQKQRVAIARALAGNPKILLCDEATSALDPQTTKSILSLLQDINKKYGITIVIITHEMNVVRQICTRVGIISNGVLVEEGSVLSIFQHPKTKEAKELISKSTVEPCESAIVEVPLLHANDVIRIVFSTNSSYEPVIANMVLKFQMPVNILKAETRNVGGVAFGEMILGLNGDKETCSAMKEYLKQRNLTVEEVSNDV